MQIISTLRKSIQNPQKSPSILPLYMLLLYYSQDYLYYIYDLERKYWRFHAGNKRITVRNYAEVSKEEITEAMQGVFPKKETDFMRLCDPKQLRVIDLLALLKEDYPDYMSEFIITIRKFLREARIRHKAYSKIRELFDNALVSQMDEEQIFCQIEKLYSDYFGKSLFNHEIGIVDGHDSSSYFWIIPARIVDYTDTNECENVAEMNSNEISIEEEDVGKFLYPFLKKYFDDELEANKKRAESYWAEDDETEAVSYMSGYKWNLTYNFYTFDAIINIIKDINDTVNAMSTGRENEFTEKIKGKKLTLDDFEWVYGKDISDEEKTELIIDFYHRFIYRMEYMMRVGKENGFDLISVMGP